MTTIPLDTLVLGGGPAGLWTLHELLAAGRSAALVEAHALGSGQTVASQGIIHGGLKYTLRGSLTASAKAIRDMPERWRRSLVGEQQPDLSATVMRSEHCHLWRTGTLRSRLGMVGARAGLRVKPERIERDHWPEALAHVAGEVFRLDEQVVSPPSFVSALAAPLREHLIKVDPRRLRVTRTADGAADTVDSGTGVTLRPRHLVLTAGLGNAELRALAGLPDAMMQRRAVHMIMLRHPNLPPLNGHCVDGAKTRVTITTDRDSRGRTVWQVGGQVSEDGTDMTRDELIAHARAEVAASLGYGVGGGGGAGGAFPPGTEWATYRLDKAEVTTSENRRPDDAFAVRHHNVVTAWPTKLALVPRLAERVLELLDPPSPPTELAAALADQPRPGVALPPWETGGEWTRSDGEGLTPPPPGEVAGAAGRWGRV